MEEGVGGGDTPSPNCFPDSDLSLIVVFREVHSGQVLVPHHHTLISAEHGLSHLHSNGGIVVSLGGEHLVHCRGCCCGCDGDLRCRCGVSEWGQGVTMFSGGASRPILMATHLPRQRQRWPRVYWPEHVLASGAGRCGYPQALSVGPGLGPRGGQPDGALAHPTFCL